MSIYESKYFINRELSWLQFNTRVLKEAKNQCSPLLERLKFIAIYATNLDEFYMIRVAGLKRLYDAGIIESGADKLTPLQQLNEIRHYLHTERDELENLYFELMSSLEKEGLKICRVSQINKQKYAELKEHFDIHLYPIVIPIAVDSTHPFPHLNNLSFAIAVKLQNNSNKTETKFGMVRIPRMLPRFIQIEKNVYLPIETIIGEFISELFVGYTPLEYVPFKVTRNADMEIEEEEADDFMELMQEGLRLRKKGEIIRLEVAKGASKELMDFLNSHLHVDSGDIYTYSTPINLSALWEIIGNKNFPHLFFAPYSPKILPPVDMDANIFSILDENDVLMFQPYESFDPVLNLIQSASKDPDVYSIRMTLYRVGKNSPIVKSLIEAAENGKQVSVLVELKARFDEENNLHWAKALESAGAHVIYGIPSLKVHAKIALIIKKVGEYIREYVHLSTGNYNSVTARIYTDISLMSSNHALARDAIKFFHNLSGFTHHSKLQTLLIAPLQIKQKLLALIDAETKLGTEGRIILKANSIVDVDIIKALYKASKAGVKIDLIVRGICCLRPKMSGISENIRVISIVGKYLEHARIYFFKNATPQIYFASADLMPRNLERRIEIMTPATNEKIAEKLFGILKLQLEDDMQSYELQADGSYISLDGSKNINSQKKFEEIACSASRLDKQNHKIKRLAHRMLKES